MLVAKVVGRGDRREFGDEKIQFLRKFRGNQRVLEHILYYQYGRKEVFYDYDSEEQVMRIRLVNGNGQNSNKRC